MNRRLLWKLCLVIVTGVVAMFYLLNYLTARAEEEMSLLDQVHQDEINRWGQQAESLFAAGDIDALEKWIDTLQKQEHTWAAVVQFDVQRIIGDQAHENFYTGYHFGRSVDWQVHLYFAEKPVMEVPFTTSETSFLILLPDRMRPGSYWQTTRIILQLVLPMMLLVLLSILLYRHIMQPLAKLELATREFSGGNFSVRVRQLLGNRNDEISELANTFDNMAARIGEHIVSQQRLIADLSHELRTPLTRLDIAVQNAQTYYQGDENLERITRESQHIRRLVEDTLALAWLENMQPQIKKESLDLVDLIDVIIDDASFEFPNHVINTQLPDSALLKHSNHRAVGQALENILRNALRFTPAGQVVNLQLIEAGDSYQILIKDQGPGVPEELLEKIFQPFFRVDKSRSASASAQDSFGLGLTLSRRQIESVGGKISAVNLANGGLCMTIWLPKA